VVDRGRELLEESLEGRRIVRIERRGAQGAELACRLPQPLGIAAGQDDVGSLGSCTPRSLEADAGAAAYHYDDLPDSFQVFMR
jgi:hypothetical protein